MLGVNIVSVFLLIVAIAALLFAGIDLIRLRIPPWWAKLVAGLLAVYGITAFVLAIKSGTPYPQLFHGASEWTALPFWLQGATVGTFFVIPLTIVLELINTLKHHTQKFSRWLVHATILGGCFAIGILAVRSVPRPQALAAVPASAAPEEAAPKLKPAEFTRDSGPTGAELSPGNYQIKQGSSPPNASNNATSLTIRDFRVVPNLGDQQAAPRHAFLVVGTDWNNIGPIPYMVPGMVDHLFLLIQGHRPATLSDAIVEKGELLMPRRCVLCLVGLIAILAVFGSEARGQIALVKAAVNYSHYRGPCPANLRFTGNIRVDPGVASYNYQWERSDGAKSQVKVVRVGNGTGRFLVVHEDWQLGRPGQVWERLRVRTGNADVSSEPANVTVECH